MGIKKFGKGVWEGKNDVRRLDVMDPFPEPGKEGLLVLDRSWKSRRALKDWKEGL